MQKLIWSGVIVIVATSATAFVLGQRLGGPRTGGDCDQCDALYGEAYLPPEEPRPITDSLPEQPIPIEGPQVVEVIDVLQAQISSVRKKEAAAAEEETKVAPAPAAPVVDESTDKAFRFMPPCVDNEEVVPAVMPYAEEIELLPCPQPAQVSCFHEDSCIENVSSNPERTNSADRGIDPARAMEEMTSPIPNRAPVHTLDSRQAPQSLPKGILNNPFSPLPRVDTLEFRPSDAKIGEFDPVPF